MGQVCIVHPTVAPGGLLCSVIRASSGQATMAVFVTRAFVCFLELSGKHFFKFTSSSETYNFQLQSLSGRFGIPTCHA